MGAKPVEDQLMRSPADQPTPNRRDSIVASRVERLYRSHVALVRSVCLSFLRDRIDAEDAVQQTFLSAQKALLNGSTPRDAAAWLAMIARNESLARMHARMREPLSVEIDEHGAAPDVHDTALQRHEASELIGAFSQLPIRQREAILLKEMRGFSSQEVAAELSLTAAAAESLLFRARQRLRVALQGAVAGLSPGLWVQPLRELATRITSSDVAAPAAKVAIVGAGAVLATGGALVGPRVLGLGHTPQPVRVASGPPVRQASHSRAPEASATFSPSIPHRPARAVSYPPGTAGTGHSPSEDRATRGDSGSGESRDGQSMPQQPFTDSTAGDSSSASESSPDSTDTGSGQQETSLSTDGSHTDSADSGSTDSSSNTATTDSSSSSDTTTTDSGQGD
jgi:RNA polymerase sigma-70 factor (ECF subfamily)